MGSVRFSGEVLAVVLPGEYLSLMLAGDVLASACGSCLEDESHAGGRLSLPLELPMLSAD